MRGVSKTFPLIGYDGHERKAVLISEIDCLVDNIRNIVLAVRSHSISELSICMSLFFQGFLQFSYISLLYRMVIGMDIIIYSE